MTSFKETAPRVFAWLKELHIGYNETVNSRSLVVVPVESQEKMARISGDIEGLTSDELADLSDALDTSPWQGKSGGQLFNLGEKAYICVPFTGFSGKAQTARQFGIEVAEQVKSLDIDCLCVCSSPSIPQGQFFVGLANGLYGCSGFKGTSEDSKVKFDSINFLGNVEKVDVENSFALAKSQIVSRHLGDGPANWLNPIKFAEVANELAEEFGYKVTIMKKDDLVEQRMGSLLSVAQGSINDPTVICMEIDGTDNSKTAVLVGKGLTFDAGGISLKGSLGMEEMKYDMCGGAAVFGAACYLAQVKPKNKVVALIGAVENMPGSSATRPGDVVRSRSGKTIEVINTDAEGRLVLVDVLDYAIETYKPDLLINVATLTGACLVALGSVGAAVLSKKTKVAKMMLETAEETGEPLWQLPLWGELRKEMKSEFADLKNIASPSVKAGTITAGIFLSEFVGDTNWAHLDIAGTGWGCSANGYVKKGGSGYGVSLLAAACEKLESL